MAAGVIALPDASGVDDGFDQPFSFLISKSARVAVHAVHVYLLQHRRRPLCDALGGTIDLRCVETMSYRHRANTKISTPCRPSLLARENGWGFPPYVFSRSSGRKR